MSPKRQPKTSRTEPLSAYRRGLEEFDAHRFLRARKLLGSVVVDRSSESPQALAYWIETFLRRGHSAEARDALHELLPEGSSLRHHGLAYLARRQGDWKAALAHSTSATSDPDCPPSFLLERGLILSLVGQRKEGLEHLKRAEAQLRASGDREGLAWAVRYLAIHAFEEMRLAESLRLLEEAEALELPFGNRAALASIHEFRARAHYHLVNYREAIASYQKSLDLRLAQKDKLSAAFPRNGLALCHLDLDHPQGARPHLLEALKAFRAAGNRWGEAAIRANLGFCSRLEGKHAAMVRHYKSAIDLLESAGNPNAFVNAVTNLAEAYSILERPQDALDTLSRLDEKTISQADLRSKRMVYTDTARALLSLGRNPEALAVAERVLEHPVSPGPMLLKDKVEADLVRGKALVACGRREEGRRAIERSGRTLEKLLEEQPGIWSRMGLVERHRAVHDALLELRLDEPRRNVALTWKTSQRAKGRSLHDAIARRVAGTFEDGTPSAIDEIEAEIRQAASLNDPSPRAAKKLRDLRLRHADLLAESGVAPRSAQGVLTLQKAKSLLGSNAALLEFHLTEKRSFLFVVFRGSATVLELATSAKQLNSAIDSLLEPLHRAGSALDPSLWLRAYDASKGIWLYEKLLAPALGLLSGRAETLWIVPDGPLHRLPFELLLEEETCAPGDAPHPGTEPSKLSVCYLPSSRLLEAGDDIDRATEDRMCAIGYSPPEGAQILTPSGPVPLTRLAHAVPEARRIAALFSESCTFVGGNATAPRWIEEAPHCRYLHFATHAIADPWMHGLSSLVVAPAENAGAIGLLSSGQIRRCSLKARLVTLSACGTAEGRLRPREGQVGLARAFLEAGARAVLATLWPVDDEVSRTLMVDLYRHLQAGASPTAALASARTRLRSTHAGRWKHPFFWAPFVLFETCPSGESLTHEQVPHPSPAGYQK